MKKIILLIALSIFSFSVSFAQEIEWQSCFISGGTDYLSSIKQTNDGGYISGGWTITSSGTLDNYYYAKTNATGTIQWSHIIGGTYGDYLNSIQQTADGGYILGGYSDSNISPDKSENSIGGFDYWIVKTDSMGIIQWENTIGGTSDDKLYSIQQTADGGYILGGQSESNISGDKTENCIGGPDYWIVKTDSAGNIQWQNTIGGNYYDYFSAIQQTSDGGFILGGYSYSDSSGDKTENNIYNSDYWIVKTDASGNIQWQNTIGGNGKDELHSIQQTADRGYILGGASRSNISGDKTKNRRGGYDYWIVKTDSMGSVQWDNTFGGTRDDYLYSVQQTTDGGYILGGYSNSDISGEKSENCWKGWSDYWVVKTDSFGNMQWQNTIGGNEDDYLTSLQQADDGGYILGGNSESHFTGDKTIGCGAINFWLIKLTEKYNSITGKIFIDANSNNVQDAGEPSVNHKQITETNTGRFSFSNQNGGYLVSVLDSGNFSVSPASVNYYNTVPANHTAYFSGIQQTDSLNDFAFQPAGVFNDLCVTVTTMGNFRAGMNTNYLINYENAGTTTLNGTVIFFPDSAVTFVSSNPIATSITADSVVWNAGSLTPFQTGSILVTVNVNAGTPLGTLINSSVRIEPVAGDANTSCNYDTSEVYITSSYDPNAIIVDRDTVLTTKLSSPLYLNYIIYFQNTGNDTAFNVKVLNPIDTNKLDIHSFEFVSSSHPVNIDYKIWERNLYFTFDNINLPDSGANEPASHGFIRYRIKPRTTLVAGDKIVNYAAIYFDFNLPVITDTAVTKIVLPVGVSQLSVVSSQLKIFPNPSNDLITINSTQLTTDNWQLSITDLFGREVYKSKILNPKSQIKINVSGFAQGIYFVELQSGEKVLRGKFLKE